MIFFKMQINIKLEDYSRTEVDFGRGNSKREVIVSVWMWTREGAEENNIQLFFDDIKDYAEFKSSLE